MHFDLRLSGVRKQDSLQLPELLQSGENGFRDGAIGGDGHIKGHRAVLGIDNANSFR